ncbi:hypothetical protein F4814DRAFT_455729 [Daldinia grandis]|nr:hypothetical protein F4814DRAFT_455729 [Daldinia grandis]
MSLTTGNEFPNYLRAFSPGQFITSQFNLGTHTHDFRFTVAINTAANKSPLLVIYDGSTDDGSVLATVSKTKDNLRTYSNSIQVNDTTVTLADHANDLHRRYEFSLKLESRREKFEWRPTQGNEVRNMFKHAKGFKLVRLKSNGPGNGMGGKRDYRHIDETSDGKEVVAVWATEKSWVPVNLMLTLRPFKFELRASGKSGELGSQFCYFAVATALKIWSYEAQDISGFNLNMAEEFPHYLKVFYTSRYHPKVSLGQHAHDLRFTVSRGPIGSETILVLHEGSTTDDEISAIGKEIGWLHQGYKMINDITLPPRIGESPSTLTSTMRPEQKLYHLWYQFSMKVGEGGELHDEKFEWRPTRGNEIQVMFKHAKGFKLVRVEAKGPGDGRGGRRESRQLGESSDGKEVVAVWATKKTLVPISCSPFKFELLGSGKTGELGRHFGYMALMTALEIWCFQVLRIHDDYFPYVPRH